KNKVDGAELMKTLVAEYADLHEVVMKDLVLDFEIELTNRDGLVFSPSTGKLRSVIDHRI
ncbi:MAG: hypothetical protein ACXVCE_12760, partial [Bacteriovorax sp.]